MEKRTMKEQRIARPRDWWQRLSLAVMGAGLASLLAAGVLLVLTLSGTIGDDGYTGPGTISAFGDVDEVLTPVATPTVPLPPPSEAPVARIAIPRFGVDAPVVARGVDANNVMESPDGPTDVAWYEFTARPGFGSNAVFSGHVDYINYGPAVFWNLKDLNPGDTIEVHLEDGTVYWYSVVSRSAVSSAPTEEELRDIIGETPREVVTLITCGGTFDYTTHQYDQRTIVRAERVFEPPAVVVAPTS